MGPSAGKGMLVVTIPNAATCTHEHHDVVWPGWMERMRDAGAHFVKHFPAGEDRATGYNRVCFFFAHVLPLNPLLPLVRVSSFGVSARVLLTPCWDGWSDRDMAGCRSRTVPDGLVGRSLRGRWGPHSSVFTRLMAVPHVALGQHRPFSQPWLCLPVLSCSNISSPTSARPKRYFCYKPRQSKRAMAGKGDKPKGRGMGGPGMAGMLLAHGSSTETGICPSQQEL